MTSAHLRWQFQMFNNRYFGNKIPKEAVVQFAKIRRLGDCSWRIYERPTTKTERTAHRLGRKSWVYYSIPRIRISRRLKNSSSLVIPTLLHEMVHASGVPGHGKKFNRAMLRLAKAGAFDGWW